MTADVTEDPSVGYDWTPAWLAAARGRPNRRRALLVAAAIVGLSLAWLHWLGLVVAGALMGLASRTVPRAVAAGLGLGVVVLVVHVLASPVMGAGEFLGLVPISYLGLAVALVAPVWGSLARAVV